MAKIGIIIYSTYGHVATLAKEIQSTINTNYSEEGITADLLQVKETLSDDVLAIIHAPAQDASIPFATADNITAYDALLFGFPTRYGNVPSQISSFLDSLGGLWASGALYHKLAGVFVSTGTPGGGQEVTIRNFLSFLAHHGVIYVPLGYGAAFPDLTSFDEFHGGSPWGAGTLAGADGSKQPNSTELSIARHQADSFVTAVKKFYPSAATSAAESSSTPEDAKATPVNEQTTTSQTARKAQAAATEKKEESSSGCAKCVIM